MNFDIDMSTSFAEELASRDGGQGPPSGIARGERTIERAASSMHGMQGESRRKTSRQACAHDRLLARVAFGSFDLVTEHEIS